MDRIAGCLYGMALGDALGAETEFLTVEDILREFPPDGPHEPPGNPSLITDDTQMAIAVAKALLSAPYPHEPVSLGAALTQAFIAWYHDPENDRAPGMTCIKSVERLMTGARWQEATHIASKGCGANMRVQSVGLLPVDATTRAALAQFQAGITHGHPTALAASDLTAWVIAYLVAGGEAASLLREGRAYGESQQRVYHRAWLGDLWEKAFGFHSGEDFIERGWAETLRAFDKVGAALDKRDKATDPCLLTGAGWIAEEALATALYCFLLYPDDPVAVMRRAAVSSGDSDSIACIAGAFAGAYKGVEALPGAWIERIEHRDLLRELAAGIGALTV